MIASRFRSERSVFALGDCALSGSPPTAQSAYQQGKYLGTMFRETFFNKERVDAYEPFKLINYGALAYVGASKGVAELKTLLWDNHPSRDAVAKRKGSADGAATRENEEKVNDGTVVVEGSHAFALWRSLYFSKLLSNRNKSQVVFDWIKTSVFGRDISSPYCLDTSEDTNKSQK
jgi:NADH:ubiquinone reductase (non-electrogenic)